MIQELRLREPNIFDTLFVSLDFIRTFFGWWYGEVPLAIISLFKRWILVIDDITSFSTILRGYFRPWKNDYNIAGWLVGMVIKSVYLPATGSLLLITLLIFIVILLIQLIIFPVIVGLIIINPFLNP